MDLIDSTTHLKWRYVCSQEENKFLKYLRFLQRNSLCRRQFVVSFWSLPRKTISQIVWPAARGGREGGREGDPIYSVVRSLEPTEEWAADGHSRRNGAMEFWNETQFWGFGTGCADEAIILIYCTWSPIKRALRPITPMNRTSPSSARILTTDDQRGLRRYTEVINWQLWSTTKGQRRHRSTSERGSLLKRSLRNALIWTHQCAARHNASRRPQFDKPK